jgi:hypothetical protein
METEETVKTLWRRSLKSPHGYNPRDAECQKGFSYRIFGRVGKIQGDSGMDVEEDGMEAGWGFRKEAVVEEGGEAGDGCGLEAEGFGETVRAYIRLNHSKSA